MSIVTNISDKDFAKIIESSTSYSAICRKLGYVSAHIAITSQIKNRIAELGLSTEHFCVPLRINLSNEDIFVKNSPASQSTLRRRFLALNLVEYKCSICGQDHLWMGKELSLTLDHIDGNNKNDVLTNLRWVCPNCDRQLDTYCAKNIRGARAYLGANPDNIKSNGEGNKCEICGRAISSDAIHCVECHRIESRVTDRPSRETLKELLRTSNFLKIGVEFGVSDNAIRKWCDTYNLPRKSGTIKRMTDKEWEVA